MNKITMTVPPIARSPSEVRREMLRANRFLGIHQVWWGGILTPFAFYLLVMMSAGEWQWWWYLAAFLLAWACVELCFFPRRLVIRQLALEESRAEAVRLAWTHDLALRDVLAPRQRRVRLSSRLITAVRGGIPHLRGKRFITAMREGIPHLRGKRFITAMREGIPHLRGKRFITAMREGIPHLRGKRFITGVHDVFRYVRGRMLR